MGHRIDLSGEDWLFKGYLGQDWLWRDANKPITRDIFGWNIALVPGTVQHDLWQAGEIPDPYFERNSLLIEWVPERTWLYKKIFDVAQTHAGKRVQLMLQGVDYQAQFFLNGELLGGHQGMFTPVVFDISNRLNYGGENLLAVVIDPAPQEVPQVGRTSEVRIHKTRMNYGWDFCPRLVHVGIWDRVYLDVTGPVRLDDVWVRPQLADDLEHARVNITARTDATSEISVQFETTLHLNGDTVAQQELQETLAPGENTLRVSLALEHAHLWYPNGAGAQPLYEAEVCVLVNGQESDRRNVSFGIRRVELAPNETEDQTARSYTFVVNGQKVYAKGWNWVPLDVMYGVERPDKLERLLTLAQRAHVNLLRVWGGGLIEKESFYEWCDRLGIMVWQEFIQSSSGIESVPSGDPAFVERMVQEAEQIIPCKRNHPSLVIWCGGNELQAGPEQPLDDTAPVLGALHEVVTRLDPDRHWLPTTPSGRVFSNNLEMIARDPLALHDVHGPWEYLGTVKQYTLYNAGTSLFHGEFGAEGITNVKTLHATIAREHQMPFSRKNPVWAHLGSWWVNESMLRDLFGEAPDIEILSRASQFLQAEGLRYAVEANLRRMYQNSGSIPWQFNEPFPNGTCTSAVDYYGEPKSVYYALVHAYEPVHVSAQYPRLTWDGEKQFQAQVWVTNTSAQPVTAARLEAQMITVGGEMLHNWRTEVTCPPNRAASIMPLDCPLDGVAELFFLDLSLSSAEGQFLSHNRYLFTRGSDLTAQFVVDSTRLAVNHKIAGEQWELDIKNEGKWTALWVRLEDAREIGAGGYVYFDDNHFSLLPGASRHILAEWQDVPVDERCLGLRGWNTETVYLK